MLRTLLPLAILSCACSAEPLTELEDDPQTLVAGLDGAMVVPTSGDTFARDGFPARVYGADPVLEVKKFDPSWNRVAYLQFPTSDFDASFTRATLRVFGSYAQAPIVVAAYGASSNWSESALTWSKSPAVSGASLGPQTVSSSTPRWYEWDVTAYVQAQKALAQPAVAFALQSLTYGNGIAIFSSKESGASSPQLVVSGASPNPPPSVATPVLVGQNPVTGTTVALSTLGADDGGEGNLTYTWSATHAWPVPVTFSNNGTNAAKSTVATFTRAGSYTMSVAIADASGASVTDNVTVEVAETPTTLRIEPEDTTVFVGTTQQFIHGVYDQFGFYITPRPLAVFSVSGGGTMTGGGAFNAQDFSGGPFTITATSEGITGQTTVKVYEGSPFQRIAALADATVRGGGFANTNFGGVTELGVKSGEPDFTRRTLMSFDTSSIPGIIKNATLRFRGYSDGTAMLMELRGIPDAWSETGVTWRNQPAASTVTIGAFTSIGQPYAKNGYALDLTNYVQAEHAAGRRIISILVAAYTSNTYFGIDARESENPPVLDITFGF